MKRFIIDKRPNWERVVSEQGLLFHTADGIPYWDEGAYYELTLTEVEKLEHVTAELWEMYLAAAQHVIDKKRYAEVGVPVHAIPLIERTWEAEPPALYSRFDLRWDGTGEPKLLELNADTPTSLLEAAAIQWLWLEDVFPGADQFNSIEPKLVAKWRELIDGGYLNPGPIHFAHDGALEDRMTVGYMMHAATCAIAEAKESQGVFGRVLRHHRERPLVELLMHQIGWDSRRNRFVDIADAFIGNIFKLFPWETMLAQTHAEHLLPSIDHTHWIEPPWKVLLTSKGLLAILWEMFPEHPNLLPAYLDGPREMSNYARKPYYSREGANVRLVWDGTVLEETEGPSGAEGYVYQALALLPDFGAPSAYRTAKAEPARPVLGSWVVDGVPAGLGIRESTSYVTGNTSRFVPHRIAFAKRGAR